MSDAALVTERKGAIDLVGVTKKYGDERVVDNINLAIRPGEFFSLLGPSGSGKTTTLLMIAGFADIDEGKIQVDGTDISLLPPQKRGFGMVFQNYAVFPHLNVFENVAFPLRARRWSEDKIRDRVNWALNLVRLEQFAQRFSRQLSGGQQQRVAIARAIVFEPRVVLMDEPLGALDKNLRYEMQVEIKEIQTRLGMTVIYVTHDQEEALNMSDRIAIMNRGKVEQVDAPKVVYERPASEFAGRFLGEANVIPGEIGAINGDIVNVRVANQTLRGKMSGQLAVGSKCGLFVRPERIAIGAAEASSDANRVVGTVTRASFLGNVMRYAVEISPAITLTVDAQNMSGERLNIGSTANLTWKVDDALVLKG